MLLLALLFDVRLPALGVGGPPARWVLLDASLSMSAESTPGTSAWLAASERAAELEADGWYVARFGAPALGPSAVADSGPSEIRSLLAPALAAAAEAGAHEVRVLSDLRFEDAVAVRAALALLPLAVDFEGFGAATANAGIARFDVPDLAQPEGSVTAQVEVHGGVAGESLLLEIFEETQLVAELTVQAPSAGLTSTVEVDLPTPATGGRVRYSAVVSMSGDSFRDDDTAVAYANVGHEAGALILVSLDPDWEPRYLLPVLEDVTGLPGVGYLRVGPDRFVRLGRAIDRGSPVDSATVRKAATDAAVLVVHGLGTGSDAWVKTLVSRPGRRLLFPADAGGASVVGLEVESPQPGEWYASSDIPTSPIAGSLSGVSLQGLPPLRDVMVPTEAATQPPLLLQLRGTGAPRSAFRLLDRASGRVAVVLSSDFWRWAMRDDGREPYRRLWSGIVGWLLADQAVLVAETRPTQWVVPRGVPLEWSVVGDSAAAHIVVRAGDAVVVDTVVHGGRIVSTGVLEPDEYRYAVLNPAGDTLGVGRFDVTASTLEMLPAAVEPEIPPRNASIGGLVDPLGRPLRTFAWPYLLVIILLCGEWIVRRRSGLR